MGKGPKPIGVLLVSNGTISSKKVQDFGSFLALQVDRDKWMAWAKGKPLLVKSGFRKRYTYLLTPEIAWTLDGDSIVNIMAKAKALAYPSFKGVQNDNHAPALTARPELLPPDKPMTEESVNGIIDQRLNNSIRTLIHDEINLAFASLMNKKDEKEQETKPAKAAATPSDPATQSPAKPRAEQIGPPVAEPKEQAPPSALPAQATPVSIDVPSPSPLPMAESQPPAKSEPEQGTPIIPEQPVSPQTSTEQISAK